MLDSIKSCSLQACVCTHSELYCEENVSWLKMNSVGSIPFSQMTAGEVEAERKEVIGQSSLLRLEESMS